MLSSIKSEFITYCVQNNVLKFATETPFVLKSGRESPWFFNAGNLMQHGEWLARLATIYTDALLTHFRDADGNIDADILYGPAYKGIPLAAVVAQEYYRRTGKSIGFSSHRKEIKDHGEWGNGFGMSVSGKSCILLDDVITAGTAFRKSVEDIEKDGGTVWWLLVLLDNGIKIVSTLTYTDIRSGIECWLIGDREIAISMDSYHEKYWIYS